MPRIVTCAPEPLDARPTLRFGVRAAIFSIEVRSFFSMVTGESAVTLTGTVCTVSARLRALTTISSRPPCGAAAASATSAANAGTAPAQSAPNETAAESSAR